MRNNFGSLGELFPETEVECRIRGCHNKIQVSGDQAMLNIAAGHRSDRMCDSCFELFNKLEDIEVPCSKSGCTGHWTWNRFQQLEAHARGFGDTPPHGLCDACREESKKIQDVEVPCRIHGCKNTWTWYGRSQLENKSSNPPRRLCEACYKKLRELKDIELTCRVRGCENKYIWTAYQQLEHLAAGKKLENPPRRMCEACFNKFHALKDIELDCKINGCKNKWVYTAYEQLERWTAGDEHTEENLPSRMCKECFNFYNSAKDLEQSCRNRGCEHTWTWTRSMQLGAWVHNYKKPPLRMCSSCAEELKKMSDIEEPCMEQGCAGTWTYKAEDQLKDKLAGHHIPQKRCKACLEFLGSHESENLNCKGCGQVIAWSVHEQLLHSLGVFDKPEFCSSCVQKQMQKIRPVEVDPVTTHAGFQVKIPSMGPWNENAVIRDWPPRMTHDTLDIAEHAALRIVCIGDDMTFSTEDEEDSWPVVLQAALCAKRNEKPGRIAVVNAGIPASTTRDGLQRFERDVDPFEPHLLIFSFAFGDTALDYKKDTASVMEERLKLLAVRFEEFVGLARSKKYKSKLLCWVPNPIYPTPDVCVDWDDSVCQARIKLYEAHIRQVRQMCLKQNVPLMDGRALYEVGGAKSALKWMSNWYLPNSIGAKNIALWILSSIQSNELLSLVEG